MSFVAALLVIAVWFGVPSFVVTDRALPLLWAGFAASMAAWLLNLALVVRSVSWV